MSFEKNLFYQLTQNNRPRILPISLFILNKRIIIQMCLAEDALKNFKWLHQGVYFIF